MDQSIDIDGNSSISQGFSTVVGDNYVITLSYSHHPGSSSSTGFVTVDGATSLLSQTLVHSAFDTQSNMQRSQFNAAFTADSTTTTLTIQGSSSNGGLGFAVDNVSVVPEPSTATLLGLGMLLLAHHRRDRPARC